MITPPSYVLKSEEQYDKPFDSTLTKRLFAYLRPHWKLVLSSLIYMTFATFAAVSGPIFIRYAIDDGLARNDRTRLLIYVFSFLGVSLLQWFFTYLRVKQMAFVGQSVIYQLRKELFEHLQDLSIGFFNRYSVGRIITRVINDVEVLREFVTFGILAILRDIFTIGGIVIAMITMSPTLALLSFSVLPIMYWATIIFRKHARRNYRKVRSAISWVNSVLAENINAVRVVQAFSRQEKNYSHFSQQPNLYHRQTGVQAAFISAVYFPVVDVLGAIIIAVVVWMGGEQISKGIMTTGVLVAFILYINRFFDPIRDLFRRFDSLQSSMAGGERIMNLLDSEIEVKDATNAQEMGDVKGDVIFKEVSFSYPDDDTTAVLENIQFSVPAGSTVALVGKTGSGKTTIIKLLSRFHDPTSGKILIDNTDIREVTQRSLRSKMGIVLQDPFLFNGSVEENIRFGNTSASIDEVMKAATIVGAHPFIENLRNGYQTNVAEGGVLLSVGQRQLLSMARALLADPRILILDEATSSIDAKTEKIIQKGLYELFKGRTSFVIAHRLSTITNADQIFVIDRGKIIEHGRHEELLEKRGKYFSLYHTGFEE